MKSIIELLKSISQHLTIAQQQLVQISANEQAARGQAEEIKNLVNSCRNAEDDLVKKKTALLNLLVELAVKTVGAKEYTTKKIAPTSFIRGLHRYKTTEDGHLCQHYDNGLGHKECNEIEKSNLEKFSNGNKSGFAGRDRLSDDRFYGIIECLLGDVQSIQKETLSRLMIEFKLIHEQEEKILKLASVQ